MTPAIVTRAGWRADPLACPAPRIAIPTPRLWLHHTAAEQHGPEGVRQTQRFHIDSRGWSDIAYSFLVDDDGVAYEGRGAGRAGAHTDGDNSKSHAIVAMGNYDVRPPPPELEAGIVDLAVAGHRAGWWPGQITGGHTDAPGAETACPGRFLEARILELNRRIAAALAGGATPTQEDDDMPLIPSWAKRQTNGRWPTFDLADRTPTSCTVLAGPGAPFTPGLDKVAAPRMRYGAKRGAYSTLTVDGLTAPPRGVAEAPGGSIILVCADGATFDVARKPG